MRVYLCLIDAVFVMLHRVAVLAALYPLAHEQDFVRDHSADAIINNVLAASDALSEGVLLGVAPAVILVPLEGAFRGAAYIIFVPVLGTHVANLFQNAACIHVPV